MSQSTFSLSWELHRNNICNGLSVFQQVGLKMNMDKTKIMSNAHAPPILVIVGNNTLEVVDKYIENGEFVDMTLAADGHHVKVHQMIMALASPYIKELISSATCPHPVIFLNKISYTTLTAILEYIYMGEVLVSAENLSELMQAARELRIKGLEDMEFEESSSKQASNEGSLAGDACTTDNNMDDDICYFEVTDSKVNTPSRKANYTLLDEGMEYKRIARYRGDAQWFSRGSYFYVACRSRGASTSMRCSSPGCRARWILRAGRPGPVREQHDHEPTPWVPSRNAMFQALKRRATAETEPLHTIYEEEAARYPDAKEHLVWESVVNSMRKWRRRQQLGIKKIKQELDPKPDITDITQSMCVSVDKNGEEMEADTAEAENKKPRIMSCIKSSNVDPNVPTPIQYTVSNQGSLQMIVNRYVYYLKHCNRNNTRQWRCVDYLNTRKCPALVFTTDDTVVQRISAHTHPFHDQRILKKVYAGAVFTALHEAEQQGISIKSKSKEKTVE